MSTIEEAREQAREALGNIWDDGNAAGLDGWVGPGRGAGEVDDEAIRSRDRAIEKCGRALLDATEPSTVAVKTEFRVLDAPKDCDYHEGFEEGVKFGRAGSGPRPITDEMVAAADFAIMPYWGERYPSGSLTTEIARAALEAAEEARR